MLISDIDRVTTAARTLAREGVRLSLDDFGTGYASLQQLRLLPLTEVKVDRSYISGMVENPADRAIVTSVHQLTRALNVDVVAEGVEDEATAIELTRLGCSKGQGWYYGRAASAADTARLLADRGLLRESARPQTPPPVGDEEQLRKTA